MLLEYEVLNINPESEEDKKIAEFAKEVESYINSKDKFINKDTTIDTKIRNYRNIMGNITKTSYNISIEGLGLCHVEKKFEYDYTSKVFKGRGYDTCTEITNITNIMNDEEETIYREYMLFNHPQRGTIYYMTKEIKKDTSIELEYDKLFRLISSTLYINGKFEVQDIYEYTDHSDGSFEVEEKKKPSEDTDPILITKSYVDKKHRLYRIDTATGSSKRIIFDDETDKKLREEYYQNEVLMAVIRYEVCNTETEEENIVCVSLIKDMYQNNMVFKSIIVEEIEKRKLKENNRLCYNRATKYHNGVKFVETITNIEFKSKSDDGRIEKQTFSKIDYTEEDVSEYKEQNIIEFDETNRATLIVTSKPGKDLLYTVMNYDDENNIASTNNEETNVLLESFEDDPETIKVFEQKEKYKPKTLYNRYNEFISDAIKSMS